MADNIENALAGARRSGRLDLSGHKLRSPPDEIRRLPNLKELRLGHCGIEDVPAWIGELTSLRTLVLGDNQIGHIPAAIRRLTNLEKLDLTNCGIEDVPAWVSDLTSLRTLVLGHNQIGHIPAAIRWLPNLNTLYLRECGIEDVPAWIGELTSLRSLDLYGNQISHLPAEIGALQSLTSLILRGNRLGDVPAELGQLRNLSYLNLEGNPLEIPPEILNDSGNPAAILDYLSQTVARPTRRLDEAKVLVVGEGSVGKTSLIRRLVAGGFSEDEQKTEGIDVTEWSVDVDGSRIRLNVWDFGGQEIMHATHQFFLTKRSMYLLVVDNRQDEEQNRIEYWLKLIQSFGGDSPVIIVGNKTDQAPLDIDLRGLRNKYPAIVDICSISCKEDTGIDYVLEIVANSIERLPHVRDPLPKAFFDIKADLEQFEANTLPYSDYTRLCQDHGVDTGASQELLVRFLHDLGTVLCFRDDPRLGDTHILNPRWVTGGVYRILNDHRAAQNKGLLRWKEINKILDTDDYPPERRMFIIDMMEKFELCYKSEGRYLIPDLLTKEEPDTGEWDGALAFEISYDVLPSSIISRLIVRMHTHISKGTVWRTGAVFSMDRNRALVRGDREDGLVTIAVTGPPNGRRGLLTAVRSELRAIHQTIPGLTAKERVRVPDHPGYWVSYNHLLNLEEAGRQDVVPEGLTEDFAIRELLAGIENPGDRLRAPSGSPPSQERHRRETSSPTRSADTETPEPAWSPSHAFRFGLILLGTVIALAAVFGLVDLALGTPAAVGVTAAAVAATTVIGTLMLRSGGRVSEKGFIETLQHLLQRS